MAVRVITNSPVALLSGIQRGIREGHIVTWSIDSDEYLTHSPTQWNRKAWFRPTVESGRLTFNIVPPRNGVVSDELYGVYHGRFIEMMLTHFRQLFSAADATAAPVAPDTITG